MLKKVMILALALAALPGILWAQGEGEAPRVKLETSMGDIVIELAPQAAPETVRNFLDYVKSGHYDGTVFHRVIPNFMIQGGGMSAEMKEKGTGSPIKNEAANGLKNDRYTIAMARTGDPHSATAQFFINVNDNDFLNFTEESGQGWGYAVFGKVVSGQEVVDGIAQVKTGRRLHHENVPIKPVTINKAVVL